eukprot:3699542-Pyramimonas_sp.AAC.1
MLPSPPRRQFAELEGSRDNIRKQGSEILLGIIRTQGSRDNKKANPPAQSANRPLVAYYRPKLPGHQAATLRGLHAGSVF